MNKKIEEKMNKAWGVTEVVSKEVKSINKERVNKNKVLMEGIYDAKTIRKYIREYKRIHMGDCIRQIEDVVISMEPKIMFVLIDVAIEEFTAIADTLIKDTLKETYIRGTVIEGIRRLQVLKLGKLCDIISEQLQMITGCKIDSSFYGIEKNSKKAMNFYIYMDNRNCKSKSKYRQFNVVYDKDVSAEEYVNLIVTNLDNKDSYSCGEIYKNVIAIKDFINKPLTSQFVISEIDGTIYYETEEIFQVDEECTVSISEENSTITIEDVGFARILIDLKNDSYSLEELVG